FFPILWLRVCDLLLAGIRRDDAVEHFREFNRSLAVSGCAVPSQRTTRCNTAEVFEHLARVTRPKPCVIRRLLRKMILETHLESAICCGRSSAARLRGNWMQRHVAI